MRSSAQKQDAAAMRYYRKRQGNVGSNFWGVRYHNARGYQIRNAFGGHFRPVKRPIRGLRGSRSMWYKRYHNLRGYQIAKAFGGRFTNRYRGV